jgi:hypothetical protein
MATRRTRRAAVNAGIESFSRVPVVLMVVRLSSWGEPSTVRAFGLLDKRVIVVREVGLRAVLRSGVGRP